MVERSSAADPPVGPLFHPQTSFGKPVPGAGDPAQLPPVKGGGFFTDAEPDVMLTEDPPARRADKPDRAALHGRSARAGRSDYGSYGESRVKSAAGEIDPQVGDERPTS